MPRRTRRDPHLGEVLMTAGLRSSLTTAIILIATVGVCAGQDLRRSTLRLVNAEADVEPSDELAPSNRVGPNVVPTPLPPRVPTARGNNEVFVPDPIAPEALGEELLQPSPNPYEATSPQPNAAVLEPPPDYFEQPPHPHSLRPRHLPRRAMEHLRNRPRQEPLATESWFNRPFGASFFVGSLFLDKPLPTLKGDPGFIYGFRLSWDFDPRFGAEMRFSGSSPGITDTTGVDNDLPKVNMFMWDLNWMYYLTGDVRWRPYLSLGFGFMDADYYDAGASRYHDTALSMPWGVGFKYRHSTRITIRFDVQDLMTFATGPQAEMHNLTITGGFEARFGGGTRKNYWPWNPGRDWR